MAETVSDLSFHKLHSPVASPEPPTAGSVEHWIVVVEDGRVEAQGKLDDLLLTSAELRRIWEGKLE